MLATISSFFPRFPIHFQLLVNICVLDWISVDALRRSERYLVFPTPNPGAATKVQLVAGLGLPMDVDVSTIIGYVMKFNYELPYNASDITQSYVRYERSTDYATHQRNGSMDLIPEDYSVGSISRWDIYRIIESSLEGLNSGRSCLLRVICETAAVPFRKSHGIVSQLLHILLTPSSTSEAYLDESDQEYHAAEDKGKEGSRSCFRLFPECKDNVLDYFTETTFG